MVNGEGEATDSVHWLVAMIQERFGGHWGKRFTTLLIVSIAVGLIAWAFQEAWKVISPVYNVLTKPAVIPYVIVIVGGITVMFLATAPLVLAVDTLKRRVMLRGTERNLDRILERQDLTDDLRAEIEEAQRNVRTGQPVSYLRPYKQMWQWLRSKFRRKQG